MSHQRTVFVTNIIAPYRIPTLRELARLVDLHVLFSAESEPNRDWTVERDLPFSYDIVGGRSVSVAGRQIYPSPGLLSRLFRLRPRIVIVVGFSVPALWAFVYCTLTRARLVVVNDGTPHTEANFGLLGRLSRELLVGAARACVGACSEAVERFQQLGAAADDCFVSLYALDSVGRPVRDFSEPRGQIRFLHAGRLVDGKGLPQILDALASLGPELDWRLTVAGSGPLQGELEAKARSSAIAHRIEFIGFVDQADLPAIYAAHDVFLFPTLLDAFGIVLLEALAAGTPVVASTLAGATRDLIVDGRNGWVVDPRDPAQLERALQAALTANGELEHMGQLARRRFEENSPAEAAAAIRRAIDWAAV
jgi:glycosyltransferase involved in cell wall biosynthesis